MRHDSIGFFWEDLPTARTRGEVIRAMPSIPETGWKPPRDLPNLSGATLLSLDTETKDSELLEAGPGWGRGKGHIVGVSIAVPEGQSWYFPIRHEIEPHDNMPVESVLAWLEDTLNTPHIPKVGANLMYDIGWLREEGIHVTGPLVDIQFAEALLSEQGDTDLDFLASKYLGENKETSVLYRWLSDFYGGPVSGRQRANIYRSPPRLAGPYAEADAALPLRIIAKQGPLLAEQNLVSLFRMECELMPLLIEMRFAGASVNLGEAERVRDTLHSTENELQKRLDVMVGRSVNVNASASIAPAFDAFGLPYPRTKPTKQKPKGAPSFTKEFLQTVEHPVGQLITDIRKVNKLRSTFVESYILEKNVNGKVYTSFHPLRGTEGGARSGRFSSSDPNLQNIPSRDEILAPLIRGIFVHDAGHKCWRKYDYSQIEYRFLMHYARGPGSDDVRALFCRDPKTDYHDATFNMVAPFMDWDVQDAKERKHKRKLTKNINFGFMYGMGIPKLIRYLGLTPAQGKQLFDAYHKAAPYVRATMEACMEEASQTGVITTILGRRSRFEFWEPAERGIEFQHEGKRTALPYELAIRVHGGNLRRAYVHKGLNRRLQGSAADMMKRAMWQCWRDGIFDATGVPRLTVHDELDFSDPGGKDEAFAEMKHVLETCMSLRVPVIADCETGPDWGHVA